MVRDSCGWPGICLPLIVGFVPPSIYQIEGFQPPPQPLVGMDGYEVGWGNRNSTLGVPLCFGGFYTAGKKGLKTVMHCKKIAEVNSTL